MAITSKSSTTKKTYTKSDDVTKYQNKLNEMENNQPAEYKPSDTVTQAQQTMQAQQNAKPQDYNSKYTATLDSLLQQITNPKEFKYDFNGDELFNYYKDLYTNQGRQASLDSMGQAAGLTGGYGNSYAQSVGNQAYNQYLTQLYDKGLEFRDRAYQQFRDEQSDLYNQYSTVSDADATDYSRWLDKYNQWQDMLNYYTTRYDTEYGNDYTQHRDDVSDWQNMLNYYQTMYNNEYTNDYTAYRDEVQDDKDAQETAYDLATTMIENGVWPSSELLDAAGISPEDANSLISANSSSTSTGGSTGPSYKTVYVDKNGLFYTYDNDGNARSITEDEVANGGYYIDKSEDEGTKGAQAQINDKYRKENDKLSKRK